MNIYPETHDERLQMLTEHAARFGITLRELLARAGMRDRNVYRWRDGSYTPCDLTMYRLLNVTTEEMEQSA